MFTIGPVAWIVETTNIDLDGPFGWMIAALYFPLRFLYQAAGESEWFTSYIEWRIL